jgi:hypothetical protein
MSDDVRPLRLATYPALQTPEAWKPIFRAMERHGWELASGAMPVEGWDCLLMLRFERGTEHCFLSFWEEADWCGNHYQGHALTVLGIHHEAPQRLAEAETESLVLQGYWEWDLEEMIARFSQKSPTI